MAIPGFPEDSNSGSVFARIAQGTQRATGSLTSAAERAVNQRVGFDVRETVGQGMEVVRGAQSVSEVASHIVSGAVGGLVNSLQLGNASAATQWGHLSPHLIARIYPCNPDGKEKFETPGVSSAILAPITESNFEAVLNWQSPFEQTGPESKAPALMAMVQTGQLATVANALQSMIPGEGRVSQMLSDAAGSARKYAHDLENRTGITKLNSRQVFSGMPPIKLSMVMHFRALSDPQAEVMEPYQRLLEWALPQKLAEDGILPELMSAAKSGTDVIKALFPSLAPQMIGFSYANNRYSPMVIESVSNPIDGPMDSNGLPLYRAVQLTLATLTALDRNDVSKIFRRGI
ncbi:hypothetical protein SAMN04244572_03192 [Azotobacter beijerinckii]|uniref:Uncharacterized protein n=1 Tax=Azotobacter beijerinckii TaxID=170623 RepID=A0A1H6X456_9GAMM|nr:hypothetical protein [Azotobacter beijerinckii]SEJ22836.1 hypothetical protein SAMN04244572_03192 [Azotobacter beijerinckii]